MDGRSSPWPVRAATNVGRQIRNAFQTAVAIAKYEAKARNQERNRSEDRLHIQLSDKQFRKVASIAEQFEEYLNELHGKNEADLARKEKTWVDGKDNEGQKGGKKSSWDWSESEERERRRKRKRNDNPDYSEDSDESNESDSWSKKKADRRRWRRSRS